MKFQSVIVPLALAVTGCVAELGEYEYHGNWEVKVSVKFLCDDHFDSNEGAGGHGCDNLNNVKVTFEESDGAGWTVERRTQNDQKSLRATPSGMPAQQQRLKKNWQGSAFNRWAAANKSCRILPTVGGDNAHYTPDGCFDRAAKLLRRVTLPPELTGYYPYQLATTRATRESESQQTNRWAVAN